MLLKASISIANDEEIFGIAMYNGTKILLMHEIDPNAVLVDNCIPATILLPPYEAVAAEIDGNIPLATQLYVAHLASKEADMYICAVLAASMKGIPTMFYLDKDAYQMSFANTFYQYMLETYGVKMLAQEEFFGYNVAYDGVILTKLFMYDFIGIDEFFLLYPLEQAILPITIPKLINEMNPYVETRTPEEYFRYFNEFKNHVKQHGKMLIVPATFGGVEDNDYFRNS